MNHASLFSGIGGFDLAAEWIGWDNIFHCEWNEFGQKILKYYWPNAISYGDISKTDFTKHRGTIDILTGGFPCQPYSLAGKRKGTEDDRHLWPAMLRAIREIQPRWIVGENVPGLVSWSKGLVFEQVQADLEAEGYEVQPVILPACGVNAPHKRDRVWIIAYTVNSGNRTPGSGINSSRETPIKKQQFAQPEFSGHGKGGITSNSTSNAVAGQNREGIEIKGAGITINEQSGGGQFKTVQFNGLDDLLRFAPDSTSKQSERMRPEQREFSEQEQREFRGSDSAMGNRDVTNPESQGCERTITERPASERGCIMQPVGFDGFPTQPPVCSRNDGFSGKLDGITFSKWRNESIKGFGNAIVPQVALQIFKSIQEYENHRPNRRVL